MENDALFFQLLCIVHNTKNKYYSIYKKRMNQNISHKAPDARQRREHEQSDLCSTPPGASPSYPAETLEV